MPAAYAPGWSVNHDPDGQTYWNRYVTEAGLKIELGGSSLCNEAEIHVFFGTPWWDETIYPPEGRVRNLFIDNILDNLGQTSFNLPLDNLL